MEIIELKNTTIKPKNCCMGSTAEVEVTEKNKISEITERKKTEEKEKNRTSGSEGL